MHKTALHSFFAIILFSGFLFLLNGCTKSKDTVPSVTAPVNNPPAPDPVPSKKWVVSTMAGSGTNGAADGSSGNAQFYYPQNMAMDLKGNLYVGDTYNFSIRKIDATGTVSTYTNQTIGNPSLIFGNIYGIVTDSQGNLFSVEYNIIRKIVSPTNSFLFAGGLEITYRDGQDLNARFNLPANIAIDQYGNMFLPDYDMNYKFQIRKVTPSGLVSSLTLVDNSGFPSDGDPNANYLYSIAVDSSGNIFVSGNGGSVIRKINPFGIVSLFAGQGGLGFTDGKGANAQFNNILGLTADGAGNIWVADGNNHSIRKITPDGTVSTVAGIGSPGFADGDGALAKFNYPNGIVVDKNGVVYVADKLNQRIRKIEYK
jgi:NHL repeat